MNFEMMTDDNDNYHLFQDQKQKNRKQILAYLLSAFAITILAILLYSLLGDQIRSPNKEIMPERGTPVSKNSSRQWQSHYFTELVEEQNKKPNENSKDEQKEDKSLEQEKKRKKKEEEDKDLDPKCKIDESKERMLRPYNPHSCINTKECKGQRICTAFGWCRGKDLCGKNKLLEACKIKENTDFTCEDDKDCRGARICSDSSTTNVCEGVDQC